jgi:uncharacterized membrane protein YebE (DUF533 family)
MNMGNLLGSVFQAGLNASSTNRMKSMLNHVGGNPIATVGGLGALTGALMGSRRGLGGAIRGGIGGGAVAMLGLMACQALRQGGNLRGPDAPPVPAPPRDGADLERHSELVLKAMTNAAKADGRIDES